MPNKTLTDPVKTTPDTVQTGISQYLSDNYAPQKTSIMDAYRQSRQQIENASTAQQKYLTSSYEEPIADELSKGERTLTTAQESQRGFAKSPLALSMIASDTDKRIRALSRERDQLLMQNDYNKASKLSESIVNEQVALTNARTQALNEYFGIQGEVRGQAAEARAQAGFETPEQKRLAEQEISTKTAIQALASQAPDAGITALDTYDSAIQKYRNSGTYKQNQTKGELELQKARAEIYKINADAAKSLSESGGTTGKLTAAQKKQVTDIDALQSQLLRYKELYQKNVGKSGVNLVGADAAELAAAYNTLMFSIAQAVGTGALQAADRQVVENLIANPTSVSGGALSFARGGSTGSIQGIDQATKFFGDRRAAITGEANSPLNTGITTPQLGGTGMGGSTSSNFVTAIIRDTKTGDTRTAAIDPSKVDALRSQGLEVTIK